MNDAAQLGIIELFEHIEPKPPGGENRVLISARAGYAEKYGADSEEVKFFDSIVKERLAKQGVKVSTPADRIGQ